MNAFKKLVGQFFLAERHVTSCHNIARRQPEGPPLGQGWPGASRGTRLNQNRSGLLKAKRGAPWHLKMGEPPFPGIFFSGIDFLKNMKQFIMEAFFKEKKAFQ